MELWPRALALPLPSGTTGPGRVGYVRFECFAQIEHDLKQCRQEMKQTYDYIFNLVKNTRIIDGNAFEPESFAVVTAASSFDSTALPGHGSATISLCPRRLGGHHGVESRAPRGGSAPSSGRLVTLPLPRFPHLPPPRCPGAAPRLEAAWYRGGAATRRSRLSATSCSGGWVRLHIGDDRRRPPPVDGHGVRGEQHRSPRRLARGGGMGSDCLFS